MKIRLTIMVISLIAIASCSKDSPQTAAVPATIEELLTEKAWKAEEIRVQLSNNTTAYYKRGGVTNTIDYNSDSLKFNLNNTGIYYYSGTQYTTTWNFIDAEKSKMTLVINYPAPLTINLEYINITLAYFKYTQYATDGGISYLASGTRTQN